MDGSIANIQKDIANFERDPQNFAQRLYFF